MKPIKRRDFVRQTARLGAGLAVSGLFACKKGSVMDTGNMMVMIPMPIQVVIDDVGWWSGEDGNKRQEPYRTGIARNHVPADYQAIADLGKGLGIRPQAATILCEWDRENILKELPTSTWMREKWDNSRWVGPWLDEAADIIRSNKQHYELTLHGVGHEYWADENFTRAEWADRSGRMRPLDQVELHLDYYARLMEQNQLGPFPESFVPTAFLHGFGPTEGHDISMAGVLRKRGITYINTPFYNMYNAEGAQYVLFGIDADVMTVDRGEDLFDWDIIGGTPSTRLTGPTCGLHWPNLLHADPERNSEVVSAWIQYLSVYNDQMETMLAPDSKFFQNQLTHFICTNPVLNGNSVDLDFSKSSEIPERLTMSRFVLKMSSTVPLQFTADNIKIVSHTSTRKNDQIIHNITLERTTGAAGASIGFEAAV